MKNPIWIDKADFLAFHNALLARFGGLSGIRNEGMLDSAINRPQKQLHYGEPSPFELAAAYATGLVKNHPFLDGNKRSGFMAAALFLEINGYRMEASQEQATIMTRDLAASVITEKAYAVWLKNSCVQK